MKTIIYNQKGEKVEEIDLPEEIFEVKMNNDLIHQVAVSQMANRRKNIAHTKDRGEVSGGGKKPWPQKHMGKARHGSIRSPLWRKGGITFGPRKEKNFKKTIPVKMKRKALFMAMSAKIKNNFLFILDKLKLDVPKTKLMAEIILNLKTKILNLSNGKKGSVLLVFPEIDKKLILAARNLQEVKTIQAKDLNCLDVLSFKYLVMPKDSVKVIEETFGKTKNEKQPQ